MHIVLQVVSSKKIYKEGGGKVKYMRNDFEKISKEAEQLIKDAENKVKEIGSIIDKEVEETAGKYNVSKWIIWTGGAIIVLTLAKFFIS
ncbi:MAG: hypothetical protein K0R78_922 [Pelosinus sp.]|jgi:hypothetical protein|nr:hypothetical protein [Pelosinus sp.]